jgi:class 3 adenylate cyclase
VAIDPAGLRWEVDGDTPATFSEPRAERVVRAVLFADMRGFLELTDEQYLQFDETVMAAFAEVLREANGCGEREHVG